jgi:hypothetical protein
MGDPQTPGRIVCLAPSTSDGAFALGSFFGQRLGHRLSLSSGEDALGTAAPLGPETRLAIISAAGIDEDVVRRTICAAPCPVIVMPDGTERGRATQRPSWRGRRRVILCGSDGSPRAAVAEVFARRLADVCSARIVVARVPRRRDTAAGLLETARERRAMMLTVGSDCVDPAELALGASITGSLLAQADRPVMIVPPWTRIPGLDPSESTRRQGAAPASPRRLRPA